MNTPTLRSATPTVPAYSPRVARTASQALRAVGRRAAFAGRRPLAVETPDDLCYLAQAIEADGVEAYRAELGQLLADADRLGVTPTVAEVVADARQPAAARRRAACIAIAQVEAHRRR